MLKSSKRRISLLFLVAIFTIPICAWSQISIDNPYRDARWVAEGGAKAWERHKANFHTHTTESDGALSPSQAIDKYHQKGYTILALTDHSKCTWPWTKWGRDPATLGMVGIAGNELSSGHHRGSLFNTLDGAISSAPERSFDSIAQRNGLSMFYHPGRYSYTIDWYVNLYKTYSHCIGLEVFNQGNTQNGDRAKWDTILSKLMPDRPVWGFSNDDMHLEKHLYKNYNILLIPSLSETNVRQAMEQGNFYFCYEDRGDGDPKAPSIESITVNNAVITINAVNDTIIRWISGGSVIGTGKTIDCAKHFTKSSSAKYVRAMLKGRNGETHTQPFGIGFGSSTALKGNLLTEYPSISVAGRRVVVPRDAGAMTLEFLRVDGRRIGEGANIDAPEVAEFLSKKRRTGLNLVRVSWRGGYTVLRLGTMK